MPSPADPDATRAQVRLRLRRWLAALAPGCPPVRRSPLRRAVLRAGVAAADGQTSPSAQRQAITAGLRGALIDAAGDPDDPFGRLAAAAIDTLRRWEGAIPPARAVAGWDALLTVLELRPSFFADADQPAALAAAFTRAARGEPPAARRARLSPALVDHARRVGVTGYLRRLGARTPEGAVTAWWTRVEGAFLAVSPPAEQPQLATTALDNLLRWDDRLAEIRRQVARGPGGEEAAQATAARFLEPRIVAAWAWLPPESLYRVARTCGRHAHLATLTGPAPAEPTVAARQPDPRPDAEQGLAEAGRWRRFFAGVGRAVQSGALAPWELVFVWLSAGVGAGEAWRTSGGPLERVGSANYARNRLLERLRGQIDGAPAPARLSNPGAPDPRSRALLALLTMRDAPDPSIEAAADVPTDARRRTPPLDDAALVSLLFLINLGPETARAAAPPALPTPDAQLLARSLTHVAWGRARNEALRARLARMPDPDRSPAAGRLSDEDVAFMLASMVTGLPSEAARWLAERPVGGAALDAWLAAEGPAHEVITRLRQRGRDAVPAPPTLPRRPVERDARLRLHLRGATDG